jgi:hypothetical protein
LLRVYESALSQLAGFRHGARYEGKLLRFSIRSVTRTYRLKLRKPDQQNKPHGCPDGKSSGLDRLLKDASGTGILKIGKALGIGTGTVQRVLMEQPRPFDVDVAEAAFASQ